MIENWGLSLTLELVGEGRAFCVLPFFKKKKVFLKQKGTDFWPDEAKVELKINW
jgi:hypothetical protein